MTLVDPSTAVIAKAKAKYGNRLTKKDYAALVKCESVSEVMRYLKTTGSYGECLSKAGSDIHRGNLENILREKLVGDFLSLCRYNRADSPVSSYLFREAEIRQLVKYLTLLSIGRPVEYIFTLPLYLDEHTPIPLRELSSAHSYRELIELIEHRAYKEILEKHKPDGDEAIDIAAIEDDFEIYSYTELYNDISKIKNKSVRALIKKLFDILVDYNNYSRLLRLKKYYDLSAGEIKGHILPFGSFTGRRLDALLSKGSFEEFYEALRDTRVGRAVSSSSDEFDPTVRGRYSVCRHELYFSTSPEVALMAYYVVTETELKNIITVIEGVRYSMAPDSILEMLMI